MTHTLPTSTSQTPRIQNSSEVLSDAQDPFFIPSLTFLLFCRFITSSAEKIDIRKKTTASRKLCLLDIIHKFSNCKVEFHILCLFHNHSLSQSVMQNVTNLTNHAYRAKFSGSTAVIATFEHAQIFYTIPFYLFLGLVSRRRHSPEFSCWSIYVRFCRGAWFTSTN